MKLALHSRDPERLLTRAPKCAGIAPRATRQPVLPAIQEYRYIPGMKVTADIPDELYRRVKAKAATQGRAVREVTEALYSAYVETTDAESRIRDGEKWLEHWLDLSRRMPPPVDSSTARDHLARARGRLDRS